MAQFRSILGDIRGSIAGTTFSRNGNAAYMRNRATPVNPRSTGQTLSRSALAYVSALWRGLTQPEQDAWKSLAATIPYTDKMGNSSFYSGFQLFMKLNKTLQSNGLSTISTAPAGSPVFPAVIWDTLNIEQDGADPAEFAMQIKTTVTGSAVGFGVQTQATTAVSAGINFVNKSAYRTIVQNGVPISANPTDLTPSYEAVFGVPANILVGNAIFVRFRLIDTLTGFVSPWTEYKGIVKEA